MVGFLSKAVFCDEKLAKRIAEVLEERFTKVSGEEYRVVLTYVLDKFLHRKKTMENTIRARDLALEELRKERMEKEMEFEKMDGVIKECEERIRKKCFSEIERQKEKIAQMEAELSRAKLDSQDFKNNFDRKFSEWERHDGEIRQKHEKEITQIIQEKDKIISNNEAQIKGFENLKLLYGKLSINHRTICESTKMLKEKINHYQGQISELMNENQTLKIRAGVAWEEMTPRPNFEQLRNFLNLDNSFMRGKSTRCLVSELSRIVICQARNKERPSKPHNISIKSTHRELERSHSSSNSKQTASKLRKGFSKLKNQICIAIHDPESNSNLKDIQTLPYKMMGSTKSIKSICPSLKELGSASSFGGEEKPERPGLELISIVPEEDHSHLNTKTNLLNDHESNQIRSFGERRKSNRAMTVPPRKSLVPG